MSNCDRCGDYAYRPIRLASITDNWQEMGDGIILFDGWEGYNTLCRGCAAKLDEWMNGPTDTDEEI